MKNIIIILGFIILFPNAVNAAAKFGYICNEQKKECYGGYAIGDEHGMWGVPKGCIGLVEYENGLVLVRDANGKIDNNKTLESVGYNYIGDKQLNIDNFCPAPIEKLSLWQKIIHWIKGLFS